MADTQAVAEQAKECDLVIVVGDPKSNNSNRLAQVSEQIAGTRAYRIGDLSELKVEWLEGVETVGVTSGASTPTPITREVIKYLEAFDPANEEALRDKSLGYLIRFLLCTCKNNRKIWIQRRG